MMTPFVQVRIICISILLCCVPTIPCDAEDYVIAGGNYPPFMMSEVTGETVTSPTGIVVDLLNRFKEKFPQYPIVYKEYPRARLNKMMEKEGDGIDLMFQSPMFTNEAVKRYYDFTEMVFHTVDVVVTQSTSALRYQKPEDLYGKRVGIIRGMGYGEFDALFEQGKITAKPVESHTQNLRKLNAGRIDAYLGNIHVSPYYIDALHLDPLDFTFSDTILFEFDIGFLVKKTHPQLLQDLNRFLHEMKQNGTITEIESLYEKTSSKHQCEDIN